MNKIEVKILNPSSIVDAEKMMVAMARLTQRGHKISNMEDFEALLDMPYKDVMVDNLASLPHPTIQKFGVINVMVTGASRRFLAQITRHQNEVKFMSGSLQYSDYSDKAQFVVPYEITKADREEPTTDIPCDCYTATYLSACESALESYEYFTEKVGRDAAGYAMPQGMRNVLLISATPYQLKHMIRQRTCNRNTMETQYVLLRIWQQLYEMSDMFKDCGPFCVSSDKCAEGPMCCKEPYEASATPTDILKARFKYLMEG